MVEDASDSLSDQEGVRGRARASWAEGHDINAGLPERLPDWLATMRPRPVDTPRVVRRGRPRGANVQVDWARTLKCWARRGHSDASLVWQRQPHGPGRLVVLWDVSGSMASYVDWYFPWLYQLAAQHPEAHVFAFGTALEDLTAHLAQPYRQAVAALYQKTALWGSGTAMGQVFSEWHQGFGSQLLGASTTVLIISDGWDAGPPEQLQDAMRRMAERSRHIAWINPLMVTEGFEPRTRALKAALHYTKDMSAGAAPDQLRRVGWKLGLFS